MPGEEQSQTRRTPEECCPDPDVLSAWLDETLDAARRPEIEAHVESCERCQEILERQTRLSGFSERAAALGHPGGLVDAEQMHELLEKIKQLDHETETELDEPDRALNSLAPSDYPGALGRLGRFEVLSVLGWGGMGTGPSGHQTGEHPARERRPAGPAHGLRTRTGRGRCLAHADRRDRRDAAVHVA